MDNSNQNPLLEEKWVKQQEYMKETTPWHLGD